MYYVYFLNCSMTGELLYVGRSVNPESRRREHQKTFLRPMVLSGVRACLTYEQSQRHEIEAILRRKPRLNVKADKRGSGRHTLEACLAISSSKLGKKRAPFSAEWRASVSATTRGRPKPAGFGAKVSAALKGMPKSPEAIAKSVASKKRNRALRLQKEMQS